MARRLVGTVAYSIGRYGWTESYFREYSDGTPLDTMLTDVQNLARLRQPLFGGGVFLDSIRVSDLDVRRDADDNTLNWMTVSSNLGIPNDVTKIYKAAEDSLATNPNVALLVRLEGSNKVYHGQHFFGGLPGSLVGSSERWGNSTAWNSAFRKWRLALEDQGWAFPALDRDPATAPDVPATGLDETRAIVKVAATTSFSVNDRVRLINWRKDFTASVRSFVAVVDLVVPDQSIRLHVAVPTGWSIGPKSIVHKERTVLIDIDTAQVEHVTHRNRGKPFFTPRGRRKRPSQ